jgi:hypothetical protein
MRMGSSSSLLARNFEHYNPFGAGKFCEVVVKLFGRLGIWESAGPNQLWLPSVARWLLAASHQVGPHCGAIEYSTRVQIHRQQVCGRSGR